MYVAGQRHENSFICMCTELCVGMFQIVQGITITPKSYELLHRISGNGLSVTYKFTRTISVFSPKMVSVELFLTNNGDVPLTSVKIGETVSTLH